MTIAGKLMELLFAQDPLSKGSSKKVVLVNLNTNTSLLFQSFNQLLRYFGPEENLKLREVIHLYDNVL